MTELPDGVARQVVAPSGDAFRRVVEVMARLRAPGGCPWDAEQTHRTLAKHLLEESYEVLEAIDHGDLAALKEELGDLLLQVLFHAEIAFEEQAFTIAEVCDGLREKLVRRHPHVFGDVRVAGAEDVVANWERDKRAEKGGTVLGGVPAAMPSLARAAKLTRRAAGAGFEFASAEEAAAKVDEELAELHEQLVADEPDMDRIEAELGDTLLALANLGRKLGLEPEAALRRSTDGFVHRFEAMERLAAADGRELGSLSRDEWRRYWGRAKSG